MYVQLLCFVENYEYGKFLKDDIFVQRGCVIEVEDVLFCCIVVLLSLCYIYVYCGEYMRFCIGLKFVYVS